MIVFRKSTNTNSFGLRGYWVYHPTTYQVHSFATSQNLRLGQTVERLEGFELVQFQGIVKKAKRKIFLETVNENNPK